MHVNCKTENAILVLGCDCEGLLRFPTSSTDLPGILIDVNTSRPINEQLISAAQILFPVAQSKDFEINQSFSDTLTLGDKNWTLYVAKVALPENTKTAHWPTMPELLRSMPKDRRRLPYLKAWQVLAGAQNENVRAVDLEDAMKHLLPKD